jgi:predicted lipid-binding transport protein (Tim44 family)
MRRLTILLAALFLALAPALADAKPGNGQSFGSRGGRTYSAVPGTGTARGGAAPLTNSMTPNSGYGQTYGQGYSGGYSNGFAPRRQGGFVSGLLGGFIGAGLGGLLFGRGFFGFHGGGGLLGLLLQLFLVYWLVSWLYRRFAGGNLAMAGAGMFNRGINPGPRPGFAPGGPRPGIFGGRSARPLVLVPADYQAFEALLRNIQAAWTAHDVNALRGMTTPEMASNFANQLSEQVSRGVRNRVTDVRLLKGDLAEAWSEGPREYATVSMCFSMFDVTLDQSGAVVDGSRSERVTVTEIWTFLRAPGGRWVLSAIQQPR